jgi:competence protein ComEC
MSHGLIFVAMIPALWGWGSLHPLGVLSNLILAPVVSLVLLALSFLALFHASLLAIFSYVLGFFEFILQSVAEPISIPHQQAVSNGTLWLWILFLHIFLHFLRLYLHQGKDR